MLSARLVCQPMCMPPAGYGSRSHVTEARPRVRERPVNYRVNYRDNHRAKYRVNAVASWFLFASPRARAASTRGDANVIRKDTHDRPVWYDCTVCELATRRPAA